MSVMDWLVVAGLGAAGFLMVYLPMQASGDGKKPGPSDGREGGEDPS